MGGACLETETEQSTILIRDPFKLLMKSTDTVAVSGRTSQPSCDLCGFHGDLVFAIVEGSMVHVCSKCRGFGHVVPVRTQDPLPEKKKHELVFEERQEVIIADAGERIRKEREQRGLTQEQLARMIHQKESWLHKIESGHSHLTPEQARFFEKTLGLHLTERYEEAKAVSLDVHDSHLTIGDLLNLKKKLK